MHGGHNDLPGRDFVHHIWIKSLFTVISILEYERLQLEITDLDSFWLLRRFIDFILSLFGGPFQASRLESIHVHFIHDAYEQQSNYVS